MRAFGNGGSFLFSRKNVFLRNAIMMRKLLVIVFLLVFAQLQAQVRIGEKEALSTAERFLRQNTNLVNSQLRLSETINSKQTSQANLFVFSIEPQGFVIISALNEVLAYSLTSDLPANNTLPGHIAYWLNLYNDQTDYLIKHPKQVRKSVRSQNEVGPLLTSIWGQGCFHNEACPFDSLGPCQHVSAGCIAIAMAQIMYYHKKPSMGIGMVSYSCWPYNTLSADFGQTTYFWEQMTDTLYESNPAVATLISHCGISVYTHYGAHSSWSSNEKAFNAFCQFFRYTNSTLLYRENHNDEEWLTMIMESLDARLPVFYAGTSSLGTHAFVCDGCDNNGLFHFNFGWDGVADGYYTLNNPSGFTARQSIIQVVPASTIYLNDEICEGRTYNFFGRSLNEGGHYSTFHNNINYELDLAVIPSPSIHCSNDTLVKYGHPIQLTASGADTYLWSTGDTTASIWVTPEKDQTYAVTGYGSNGCYAKASVKVKVEQLREVLVYPNPAIDKTTINMFEIDEVEVFNLLGERICHINANREAVELDVTSIPNGIYIVLVKQLKNLFFEKLIVCH